MPTTLWNPNTPVWDQARGEPYIDPETGDAVLARPSLKVTAADGRVLDGDDVANSVYWQVNLFEGEVARARGIGVPYERLIFSPGTPVQAKLTIIMSEAQRVRGVGAILGARGITAPERLTTTVRLGTSWPGWEREWPLAANAHKIL